MVRIFNHARTYRLEAEGDRKDFIIVKPLSFADIPEKYTGDITFRMAVKAGEIEVFTDTKQGEAIEAKAYTAPAAAPKKKAAAKQ